MSMQTSDVQLSRREREKLYKRSEILRVAQEVFAEKGYAKATLEEIALRAEFGKGTLYNYFPSGKQEILLSIFESLFDQMCVVIETTFTDNDDRPFRKDLYTFFERTFAFFLEKLDLFVILIREAHRMGGGDDPAPQAFFVKQRNRTVEALAIPIQRAIDRGEINAVSSTFLAHIILVNVNGCQMKACNLWSDQSTDSPESSAEMAEFLTQLICSGISVANEPVHDEPVSNVSVAESGYRTASSDTSDVSQLSSMKSDS
jgi:AcrR family transcriptional regulator